MRESKSNGRIERAIKKRQAQFRTIRHHIESGIGEKVENESPIMEWMVVWVADIISKYQVKDNGRISYEMITQHTAKHKVVGFAEKVDYMMKIQAAKKNSTSNDKSGTGYFIGIVNRNTQCLVAASGGIIACSTIRKYPGDEAYDKECNNVMKIKYSDYIEDGSRTLPLSVRTLPMQPATGVPDPNPVKTSYTPRAFNLRQMTS